MSRTRILLVLIMLLLCVLLVAPMNVMAQETLQSVCLITDIGRINDATFNQSAYEGMDRAVEEFGLENTYIETQDPSDYESNINTCLDANWDIIITVGYALEDATYAAAVAHPEVYFIGIDQDLTDNDPLLNMVGLQFREDQAGFLAGVMAALMTDSNIVAGVYGLDIPPVVKFRNGYEQGARYVDPSITVLGVYIPDFQRPDLGQEAAIQFIGDGADVIFGAGGPTGSGGISYAAGEGVYVIGVDQDEYFTTFGDGEAPGAEFLIGSAIKRVDNGVYDMISAAVDGTGFPENSNYVLEIANDGISFAPPHDSDLPQEVTDEVQATLDGLRAGTIVTGVHPVTGELLPSITQVLTDAGNFTILLQAIEAAGLTETLQSGGPFTLFAPTDEAITAALEALGMSAEDLLADSDLLTSILQYHVVQNAVLARDLMALDGTSLAALSGAEIAIGATDDGIVLNDDVNVVESDLFTANGVVHVIDMVLHPPSE